jgi:hypothetical protein
MAAHEDYVPAPIAVIPSDGLVIEFPDAGRREAGELARDLKLALDNTAAEAAVASGATVAKVDPKAQDLGTISAIVLGAKATVAIAGGIALWMRRKNQARIRLRYADGTPVDISGVESRDVAKIVQALKAHKPA